MSCIIVGKSIVECFISCYLFSKFRRFWSRKIIPLDNCFYPEENYTWQETLPPPSLITISRFRGSFWIKAVLRRNKPNYDGLINRPLLSLSTSVSGSYIPAQDFTKKNKIFELATIFNDKLQQILAKFSYNDSPQYRSHSMSGDMPEDKNAINCEVKK